MSFSFFYIFTFRGRKRSGTFEKRIPDLFTGDCFLNELLVVTLTDTGRLRYLVSTSVSKPNASTTVKWFVSHRLTDPWPTFQKLKKVSDFIAHSLFSGIFKFNIFKRLAQPSLLSASWNKF